MERKRWNHWNHVRQGNAPKGGILVAASAGIVLMGGCASQDDFNRLSKEVKELQLKQQQLEAKLDAGAGQTSIGAQTSTVPPNSTTAPPTASTTATTDATTEPTTASGTTGNTKTFTDIAGVFGEKEIKDLVAIGVIESTSDTFRPAKPVTRAEFVRWLVKSNNLVRKKNAFIRPAEPGTPSSFTDVTEANPDFKYIQGMADAGWSVGFPDKTFRPDEVLTREQMIGIKNPIDWNTESYNGYQKAWSDGDKINKNFLTQMSTEAFGLYQCNGNNNWSRIFGKTKVCIPQKPVSRAEAAMCVWAVGAKGEPKYTAANGTPKED